MSGQKGKGNSPLIKQATSRQIRRHLKFGKGTKHQPPAFMQTPGLNRKGVGNV